MNLQTIEISSSEIDQSERCEGCWSFLMQLFFKVVKVKGFQEYVKEVSENKANDTHRSNS